MHDIFESRRDELGTLKAGIGRRDEQLGMLAAVGGRFVVLDHVSRPDVFATLHEPLVQGYALDALDRPAAEPPTLEQAEAFLSGLWEQPLSERDGIGQGRDGRFAGDDITGAALLCGDELVQLAAFAGDEHDHPTRRTHIRRPSRRRAA
jgi:hypothetical protein